MAVSLFANAVGPAKLPAGRLQRRALVCCCSCCGWLCHVPHQLHTHNPHPTSWPSLLLRSVPGQLPFATAPAGNGDATCPSSICPFTMSRRLRTPKAWSVHLVPRRLCRRPAAAHAAVGRAACPTSCTPTVPDPAALLMLRAPSRLQLPQRRCPLLLTLCLAVPRGPPAARPPCGASARPTPPAAQTATCRAPTCPGLRAR